jgi:hypothetical protein
MSEQDMGREAVHDGHPVSEQIPAAMPSVSEHVAEVISLDSMRSSVLTNLSVNFEQDDLDVPAFLRKRNDVM